MNEQAVVGALHARLLTLGWDATRTAFEGKAFTPDPAVAYQEVTTDFRSAVGATLAHSSWGQGIFQVRVMWPVADVRANGVGAPRARAQTIKASFARNLVLTGAGGQVVKVMEEPVITRGPVQGDRDVTIVRFRFRDR